jgi:hypothetical protein
MPLRQPARSTTASAILRDDECAYRYYNDLTETKRRTREAREGTKLSQASLNRYETLPNDSSADITPTNAETHLKQRLNSEIAPQPSARILVPSSRP